MVTLESPVVDSALRVGRGCLPFLYSLSCPDPFEPGEHTGSPQDPE